MQDVTTRYQGLGFSVLGDSISTLAGSVPDDWRIHYERGVREPGIEAPADTWWGSAIARLGGHLVANSSYSGATVEGYGFPAGESDERVQALVGPDGTLPDVVLVFMGVNDYGWGGAYNQVMGGSGSATARPSDLGGLHEVRTVIGEGELDGFERAYAEMLGKVHRLAPEAEIWCLTIAPGAVATMASRRAFALRGGMLQECALRGKVQHDSAWQFKYRIHGVDLDAYNDAVRRSAQAAGAHVADVRAWGVDLDTVDGAHPTARGMQQLAAMVVAEMSCGADAAVSDVAVSDVAVASRDASSLPELTGAPASRRRCDRSACPGCRFADPTPRPWNLVCKPE